MVNSGAKINYAKSNSPSTLNLLRFAWIQSKTTIIYMYILEDISNRVFAPKIYKCIGTPSANFRSINSNKSPIELKFIGEFPILTISGWKRDEEWEQRKIYLNFIDFWSEFTKKLCKPLNVEWQRQSIGWPV